MSSPSPDVPAAWASRGGMTLDRLAIGMFVLLAIEFLLGMALALFVSLPSGSGVVAILTSTPVLDLHILFAVFLIGISARAIVLSRGQGERTLLYASVLAFVSSLVATAAGWSFAFDGQAPDASFVMSLGFLGVLLGAFVLARRRLRADDFPGGSA
jgi:hypothetical protein